MLIKEEIFAYFLFFSLSINTLSYVVGWNCKNIAYCPSSAILIHCVGIFINICSIAGQGTATMTPIGFCFNLKRQHHEIILGSILLESIFKY